MQDNDSIHRTAGQGRRASELVPVVVKNEDYEREQRMLEELRVVLRLHTAGKITMADAEHLSYRVIWSGSNFLHTRK